VLLIKNVILYDIYGHVVGFVEVKNSGTSCRIRVKHNIVEDSLTLDVNGQKLSLPDAIFEADVAYIDITKPITITITQEFSGSSIVMASGSVNNEEIPEPELDPQLPLAEQAPLIAVSSLSKLPPIKTLLEDTKHSIDRSVAPIEKPGAIEAVREVNEALRAICKVDEHGNGICNECPYREFFFGAKMDA